VLEPSRPEAGEFRPLTFEAPIGCPLCRAPLTTDGRSIFCPECQRSDCPKLFRVVNGFPDLVIGDRFEDELTPEQIQTEERNSEHSVRHYWAPLFRRITDRTKRPAVLALGCGTGVEVDALREAGFDCVGIDNGNRTRVWSNRRSAGALAVANAIHLPFPDGYFDISFCGCVFPHVGVVGDSSQLSARFWEDRLAVAREMARVVKPGGQIIVSSPNRWFLLDLFHGRDSGSFRTPINMPWRRFLLAAGDYRRLFTEAGCAGPATAEPVRDYWGFCQMQRTAIGRAMSIPVKALLLVGSSRVTRILRTSGLVPWIVMRIRR
jgi:SAM-dependent methyltransferase